MRTVSVLDPNYNRGRLSQDAVRSVLVQSYQDFEILVVDDGSTEDIPAALAPFSARVQYVRKENGGCASAKNFGLGLVTGEYLAVLDNDDLWLPAKLERQVEELKRQPNVGMVSCQVFVMDDDARVLARPPQGAGRKTPRVSLAELAEQNVIVGGSSAQMVRTNALRDIGGFDTSVYHDDWDCWVRLAYHWRLWDDPRAVAYDPINSQGYRNHAPLPERADAVHKSMLTVSERAFEGWWRRRATLRRFVPECRPASICAMLWFSLPWVAKRRGEQHGSKPLPWMPASQQNPPRSSRPSLPARPATQWDSPQRSGRNRRPTSLPTSYRIYRARCIFCKINALRWRLRSWRNSPSWPPNRATPPRRADWRCAV